MIIYNITADAASTNTFTTTAAAVSTTTDWTEFKIFAHSKSLMTYKH
jgi:hypothetical protein